MYIGPERWISFVGWLPKGQPPVSAVCLQSRFTHQIGCDFLAKRMGSFWMKGSLMMIDTAQTNGWRSAILRFPTGGKAGCFDRFETCEDAI
ncbi:MAG: hypothetical protein COA78_20985 [Blastopirellula sp.]|nr:MAG: hypothetical protein COA78_20985 [Blastopirellula sp.]